MLHSENQSTQLMSMNIAIPNDIFSSDLLLYGGNSNRRIVFIDENFYRSGDWCARFKNYFIDMKIEVTMIPVSCSEDKKDIETLLFVLGAIERFNLLRRDEPVIAVGGGVLMDVVGLAASIFRRGVPYIKVPTTLLGMVDAGLGAKTSINHFGRRNRLGSYFSPIITVIDKQFLKTLSKNEMKFALGEIIKIAVIKDKTLFDMVFNNVEKCLSNNFNCDVSDLIIKRSVDAMMEELVPNLWETELKRIVDFGHTFSPIPEMESLKDKNVYSLSHGEAVALDVLFSSRLSMNRNILSKVEYEQISEVIQKSGLINKHPYFQDPYMLWDSLLDATRHRNGNQNAPIPVKIGSGSFLQDINLKEIKQCLNT